MIPRQICRTMGTLERLARDVRDVAHYDRCRRALGPAMMGDLARRHKELARLARLWAEAEAGDGR